MPALVWFGVLPGAVNGREAPHLGAWRARRSDNLQYSRPNHTGVRTVQVCLICSPAGTLEEGCSHRGAEESFPLRQFVSTKIIVPRPLLLASARRFMLCCACSCAVLEGSGDPVLDGYLRGIPAQACGVVLGWIPEIEGR